MNDIAFLLPLLLGAAFFLGSPVIAAKAGGRIAFGVCLMMSGLMLWLSSALLLVYRAEIILILDLLMIPIFFSGIALLLPRESTAAWRSEEKAASPYVKITVGVMILGGVVGVAHAVCTQAVPAWPAYLLEMYGKIGLHGPALPPEGVKPLQ